MADLGVALTWLAISAASAKGLAAFARASAISDAEDELSLELELFSPPPAGPRETISSSHLLGECP